jgi:hypothetical protein
MLCGSTDFDCVGEDGSVAMVAILENRTDFGKEHGVEGRGMRERRKNLVDILGREDTWSAR